MEDYLKEAEGKRGNDRIRNNSNGSVRRVWVPGAVIVGAGPSGLAVAACLKQLGIPRLVLERSNCIASLWQLQTYDRLRLHLPKHLCELPNMPYPPEFPTYPTKQHFISYVESYVEKFSLNPVFNRKVVNAEFDPRWGLWRVKAVGPTGKGDSYEEVDTYEYVCRWLVAATGENAEVVVPEIQGLGEFRGKVMHTSEYKCGEEFRGNKVLVVGCGNSGMEVSLDLFYHSARPCLVVRDLFHVLPKEMLGTSTFGLSMRLMKWLPVRAVDRILLLISRLTIGNTEEIGLHRPSVGPMELKDTMGKTPVLDIGTLAEIRAGNIKTVPGIRRIMEDGVEFIDGRVEGFDAIIFATGFKSNVSYWLKGSSMFSKVDGFPVKPFPDGWKGDNGLYAAGFTKRGILGLSLDAKRIAEDIEKKWKANDGEKQFMGSPNATLSQFLGKSN